jgi:hypothetical protein
VYRLFLPEALLDAVWRALIVAFRQTMLRRPFSRPDCTERLLASFVVTALCQPQRARTSRRADNGTSGGVSMHADPQTFGGFPSHGEGHAGTLLLFRLSEDGLLDFDVRQVVIKLLILSIFWSCVKKL